MATTSTRSFQINPFTRDNMLLSAHSACTTFENNISLKTRSVMVNKCIAWWNTCTRSELDHQFEAITYNLQNSAPFKEKELARMTALHSALFTYIATLKG